MTKLLLLTLSLATGALPTKTPVAKKFLSALQKEINAVAKKVPQGVKQGFKKIGDQLEQKGGKKALQKTETSLLRQTEKQSLKTAEKQALEKSNKLLQNPYKNVDHLIESIKNFEPLTKGPYQAFIKGNGEAIFKALSEGGKKLESGAIRLKDGTYLKNIFYIYR